jgi:hypothetical protein
VSTTQNLAGTCLKVTREHPMPPIYAADIKERLFPACLPSCVTASPVRSRGTDTVVISAGNGSLHHGMELHR